MNATSVYLRVDVALSLPVWRLLGLWPLSSLFTAEFFRIEFRRMLYVQIQISNWIRTLITIFIRNFLTSALSRRSCAWLITPWLQWLYQKLLVLVIERKCEGACRFIRHIYTLWDLIVVLDCIGHSITIGYIVGFLWTFRIMWTFCRCVKYVS